MRILVTGARGFIGKNLIANLKNEKQTTIYECDINTSTEDFEHYCKEAEFVYHLAGSNRPKEESDFIVHNTDFTNTLVTTLSKYQNYCPIVYASSIQATQDNPYGRSKKAGEELLINYAQSSGARLYIYRFKNVFGKWCRPNYNSVVATFCHNIAQGLPIEVHSSEMPLELVYIDDLVEELINKISNQTPQEEYYYEISKTHTVMLIKIAELLHSFRDCHKKQIIPDLSDLFTKKLYSTYLSYLPVEGLCQDLLMHSDHRGSFTEFLKQESFGQVSVNISKPGILKGNHWHNSKNERFLVVSGEGVIRLRNLNSNEVISYYVTGKKLQFVYLPCGYVHNIENLGDTNLVTIIWANESFDSNKPDTNYGEV